MGQPPPGQPPAGPPPYGQPGQQYPSQDPYAQQQYPQDPYAQQQYPQDPYAQQQYGYGPGGPGGPPPRKKWPYIVVPLAVLAIAGGVVGIVLASDGDGDDQAGPTTSSRTEPGPTTATSRPRLSASTLTAEPARPPAGGSTVRYELSGQGSAYVSYSDSTDYLAVGPEEVELPWSIEVDLGDVDPALIGSTAGGNGEVSCKITVNGAVVVEESDAGDGFADCIPE